MTSNARCKGERLGSVAALAGAQELDDAYRIHRPSFGPHLHCDRRDTHLLLSLPTRHAQMGLRIGPSGIVAATTGAVILALGGLGLAWAACVDPGDLVADGIDCLRFDPTTPTDVTTSYDDAKLIPGAGFLQLGLESFPGGGYPFTNIQYAGPSYVAVSPPSSSSSLFPDSTHTNIQSVTVTRPSYVKFTIPAGAAPLHGAILQVVFTVNNDGAATNGVLADQTLNDYFSATRTFRTLAPTKQPTRSPTVRKMRGLGLCCLAAFSRLLTLAARLTPRQRAPTQLPSTTPTQRPTQAPTTASPTRSPSQRPTQLPTQSPSQRPTQAPTTAQPTRSPSVAPSKAPSTAPTQRPTAPTQSPSQRPTQLPTTGPSRGPTRAPVSG